MNPNLMELERALAGIQLNPEPLDACTEALKQKYEVVLDLLESEFLSALISGDWSEFMEFIATFKSEPPSNY